MRSRILCIADTEDSLTARKRLLETYGYLVLTADSVPSAFAQMSKKRVDAVILDYKADPITAFEVASKIRADYGGLPVVLLSGEFAELSRELLGIVDAFVIKRGHSAQLLLLELRRLLNRSSTRRPGQVIAGLKEYFRRIVDRTS